MDSPTKLKASKPKIDLRYADLVFIGCYFVSGMLDSSAYSAWTCFVSMQTGKSCHLSHLLLLCFALATAEPGLDHTSACDRDRLRVLLTNCDI